MDFLDIVEKLILICLGLCLLYWAVKTTIIVIGIPSLIAIGIVGLIAAFLRDVGNDF